MKFQDLASLLASKPEQEDEMMSIDSNADINQITPPPEMPRQKSPDEILLERLSTPDIQQRQQAALSRIQPQEMPEDIPEVTVNLVAGEADILITNLLSFFVIKNK